MSAEQFAELISRLDKIVFLLQSLMMALCCIASFVVMKFVIHAKNQKDLL